MAKSETNRGKLARCLRGVRKANNQETHDKYVQQIEELFLDLGSVVSGVIGQSVGRVQLEVHILPLVKAVEDWRRSEAANRVATQDIDSAA